MKKIFVVFLLFLVQILAAPPTFEPTHVFELKKDEWARIFITEKATQRREVFDFRWTLFDSTNLTIQSFFRRYPRQFVLSLRHGQDSYMQRILPDFTTPVNEAVKMYLTFIKFENRKASFKIGFIDEARRIDVEFVDPPTRNRGENETNR